MLLFLILSLNSFSLSLDFVSYEWKHILREECNTLSKDGYHCKKACSILKGVKIVKGKKQKYIREINCLGLTMKYNADFYFKLINENLNSQPNFLSKTCTEPTLIKIKKRYYNKYFKHFEKLDKCIRLAVFDINVLSGKWNAKKYLKRGLKTGLKGKKLRDYILKDYAENHLKVIKFEGTDVLMHTEYGGWFKRIKRGKKLSEKFCR